MFIIGIVFLIVWFESTRAIWWLFTSVFLMVSPVIFGGCWFSQFKVIPQQPLLDLENDEEI
tara:strand:- start:452 stop:634 length:183 start_codon:yes stop_codon:yes gene_type:complete